MNGRFLSRRSVLVVAMGVLATLGGCGSNASPSRRTARTFTPDAYVPNLSGFELKSLVQRSEKPVMVEFGVSYGCFRCDKMRSETSQLARRFEGRAKIVRVDFNANRQLAMQFGATICPSYVLFNKARVVSAHRFPTSADLLAAELDSVTSIKVEAP